MNPLSAVRLSPPSASPSRRSAASSPSRRRRRAVAPLIALVVATGLVLTGCTPAPDGGAAPSPASTLPSHSSSTPVPAPSGGTTADEVAAPAPVPTTSAAIGKAAEVDNDISVRISKITATTVKAETPGEIDGDAVVVTVEVENAGSAAADVDSAVVDLVASDGTYGVGTTAGDGKPFSGTVAAGATTTARYVFMMTEPRGRAVTVTVSHAAGAPVAVFEGPVS